jgi:hypothetical protein
LPKIIPVLHWVSVEKHSKLLTSRSGRFRIFWKGLIIASLILVFMALFGPTILPPSKHFGARITTVSDMKDLHKSLVMFAMDNDGSFPSEELAGKGFDPTYRGAHVLKQLEEGDGMYLGTLTDLLAIRGKSHGPWIYLSGQKNTADAALPLLISPEIEGEVVVLRIGGEVRPEPAKNLATLLSSSPATPIAIPVPKR